MNHFS